MATLNNNQKIDTKSNGIKLSPLNIRLYLFYQQRFNLHNSAFLKSPPLPTHFYYSPQAEYIFEHYADFQQVFKQANQTKQKQLLVLQRLKEMIEKQSFALSKVKNNPSLTQRLINERESVQALLIEVKQGNLPLPTLENILSLLPEEQPVAPLDKIEKTLEDDLLPIVRQKAKLNILYVSDIHTEFFNIEQAKQGYRFLGYSDEEVEKADVIVIAGDLGALHLNRYKSISENENLQAFMLVLESFLTTALKKDVPVLFISGNHEFYHSEYKSLYQFLHQLKEQKILEAKKEQEKMLSSLHNWNNRHSLTPQQLFGKSIYENFFILQDHFIELDKHKVAIFASTFWTSPIEKGKPTDFSPTQINSQEAINDFKRIQIHTAEGKRFISPSDLKQLNNTSLIALKKAYFERLQEDYTFIVVSHHLPTSNGFKQAFIPHFDKYHFAHFYYSPLWMYLAVNHIHVDYWIHGHFHFSPPSYLMADEEMLKGLKQKLAFDIVQKYKQQGNFYIPKEKAQATKNIDLPQFENSTALKEQIIAMKQRQQFAKLRDDVETTTYSINANITSHLLSQESSTISETEEKIASIKNLSDPIQLIAENNVLNQIDVSMLSNTHFDSETSLPFDLDNIALKETEEYNPDMIAELQEVNRIHCHTVVLTNCFGYIQENSPSSREQEYSIYNTPFQTCYKQITAFEPKTYQLPLIKIRSQAMQENICNYMFNQYAKSYQERFAESHSTDE